MFAHHFSSGHTVLVSPDHRTRKQNVCAHSPQDPRQVTSLPFSLAYLLIKHFVRASGFLSFTESSSFLQKKAISSLSKLPVSFHCCFLEQGPWRQHQQCGLFQALWSSTHISLTDTSLAEAFTLSPVSSFLGFKTRRLAYFPRGEAFRFLTRFGVPIWG